MRHVSAQGHKRVWLVGGSQLAASFRSAGFITEYVLSVIPVILGAGRPLFARTGPEENLRLVDSKAYPSGVLQTGYVRAGSAHQAASADTKRGGG
jgi:dihydrofolate reductase